MMDRPKGRIKSTASKSPQPHIPTASDPEKEPNSLSPAVVNNDDKSLKENSLEQDQKQHLFEQVHNKDNKNTPTHGERLSGEVSSDEDNSIKRTSSKSSIGRRSTPKVKKRVSSQDGGTENSKLRKRRREKVEDGRRKKKKLDEDGAVIDNENWVQCERCLKWRLIPSVENLPEKWYCEMNVTDTARNSCDASEQTQEEVAKQKRKNKKKAALSSNRAKRPKSQSPMTVPKRPNTEKNASSNKSEKNKQSHAEMTKNSESGDEYLPPNDENSQRSRYPLKTVKSDEEPRGRGDNGDNLSLTTNNRIKSNKRSRQSRDHEDGKVKKKGRKPKEEKQQEWVQCEKCEKWRRLPARISAKDLPDIWYCSMNTWDPRSASCAIHEEDFHGIVGEDTNVAGGIMGGSRDKTSSSSRTTYRDLIQQKGTRPISERTRATESIFSSHASAGENDRESLGPPVVSYHNSSAFQQRLSFNKMNAIEKNTEKSGLSLFALMAHSQLWRDLCVRPNGKKMQNSWRHQTESCSNAMKAMVYYALGNKTMACHEVLFECQTGEWEELLWINLRAASTLESVALTLNELEKDGLVEKLTADFKTSMEPIRFRRAVFEGVSSAFISANSVSVLDSCNKSSNSCSSLSDNTTPNSRCMKIAKPWKKPMQASCD